MPLPLLQPEVKNPEGLHRSEQTSQKLRYAVIVFQSGLCISGHRAEYNQNQPQRPTLKSDQSEVELP